MSVELFLVLVAVSAIITPIVVLLIPRARRSTAFDALLWGATLLVAFLGGWYMFGMADPKNPLGGIAILGVPIVSVAIGALVGAMIVNLPLWLLDRFEHPDESDDEWEWDEQEETRDDESEVTSDDNIDDEPSPDESSSPQEQREKSE